LKIVIPKVITNNTIATSDRSALTSQGRQTVGERGGRANMEDRGG